MKDLLELSEETLALVADLRRDVFRGLKAFNLTYATFLRIFYSQFECLRSVLLLLKCYRYRDYFILLRTVFETYFLLLQMLEGRIYRASRKYIVRPHPGHSKREARDATFDKWKEDWRSGKYPEIIDIRTGREEDVIHVTYQREGLYEEKDTRKEGEIVTRYFFAWEDYDPEVRFLAKLPTVLAGQPYKEVIRRRLDEQKLLYHHYIYFDSILKNLRINSLITQEQEDHVRVHYNFLSSFGHTTKFGLDQIQMDSLSYCRDVRDEILDELIMLYVCRLQFLYLSTILEYFKRINKNFQYSKYQGMTQTLNESTKDFWFIFNEPTSYDVAESDARKKHLRDVGEEVDEETVIYYANPLERLKNLKRARSRII